MSVFIKADYTTANGFLDTKHARILHAGNWTQEDPTITATSGNGVAASVMNNTLTYEKFQPAALPATIDFAFVNTQFVNCVCIGAHTLKGSRVTLQYFTLGSYVDVGSVDVEDNSAIMFLFNTIGATLWRLYIQPLEVLELDFLTQTFLAFDNSILPLIGVVKFGQALQMQRPFYGGHAPSIGNRNTVTRGHMSEGGEWLGRSTIRVGRATSMQWLNLSYDWVQENLYGPRKLIESLELQPFFAAWRPGVQQDCDFAWTAGPVGAPALQGVRDLMTFGLSAQVYGDD